MIELEGLIADPDLWSVPLQAAMSMFDIDSRSRQQMFIAQVAHESQGFTKLRENLNYSAAALLLVWPRHFTPDTAQAYQHQPERIANRAYANMNGNRDEASGDGWTYRGRGLIQLTTRGNYARCGHALGIPLIDAPDLLEQPEWAAKSAAWFWATNGCNELADADDFEGTTKRINGGLNGQDDRLAWLARVEAAA